MTPSEVEAFLAEMEQDIRAADRDLREIEMLEKKNVTAAGKLPDYEALKPRLERLLEAQEEDLKLAGDLERRIAALMDQYATNVRDILSQTRSPLLRCPFCRPTRSQSCLWLGMTTYKKQSTK